MYIYHKETDKFKFEFDGLEKVDVSYSQCMQDMWVLSVLNGRRSGTWLEIGCAYPQFISNTYLLESKFGWNGLSLDIDFNSYLDFQKANRKAEVLITDATTFDYRSPVVSKYGKRFNYGQFDIEPNTNTLKALKKFPLDLYRFDVITFETDFYDPTQPKEINMQVRKESREILSMWGYKLVAGNISDMDTEHPFEDWYIDGMYFESDWIKKFKRNSDEPIPAHKYLLND